THFAAFTVAQLRPETENSSQKAKTLFSTRQCQDPSTMESKPQSQPVPSTKMRFALNALRKLVNRLRKKGAQPQSSPSGPTSLDETLDTLPAPSELEILHRCPRPTSPVAISSMPTPALASNFSFSPGPEPALDTRSTSRPKSLGTTGQQSLRENRLPTTASSSNCVEPINENDKPQTASAASFADYRISMEIPEGPPTPGYGILRNPYDYFSAGAYDLTPTRDLTSADR
ncbi:hypothetical protein BC567DRAFT_74555, partial [Phyllosticta citribraziliensis]